jgi:hypothetical protein
VEGGTQGEQPPEPQTEPQPEVATDVQPPAGEDEQTDLVSFIDGLVVLLGYGWLACGVLLLLGIPLGLLLFNRWGRLRRQP